MKRIAMSAVLAVTLALAALATIAAEYPQRREGDWVVRDFRFHTGEVLPELKLHYTTIGAPSGEPVLILHGTADKTVDPEQSRLLAKALKDA